MGWLLVSQPQVPDSADIHKVRLGLLGHESRALWFRKTGRWWALKVSSDWWLRMDYSWYLYIVYSSPYVKIDHIIYITAILFLMRINLDVFHDSLDSYKLHGKKHFEIKKHVHRISSAPSLIKKKDCASRVGHPRHPPGRLRRLVELCGSLGATGGRLYSAPRKVVGWFIFLGETTTKTQGFLRAEGWDFQGGWFFLINLHLTKLVRPY